ncbi:MAG: VWA domain-containing protein [Candidatus Contendobacter sp.]|nr:VWA domain-containing protein [Candidatus Contendobacter sp.]
MNDDLEIKIHELTENPSARVSISLCLDVSGSMGGEPIRELNEGIHQFFSEVRNHKLAKYSADICIVTFGNSVRKIVDFRAVDQQRVPQLVASGATPMGKAVNLALDTLEFRKNEYKAVGVDYYQPWLVLMTDGQPTDEIAEAAGRAVELVNRRKLTVFPIGIGPHADLAQLAKFSPLRSPMRLKGLAFVEFFTWLSKSIVRTSATSVSDKVELPATSWANSASARTLDGIDLPPMTGWTSL